MVTIVLLSIVGAVITATSVRYSRGSRAARERTELQDQLREGAAILYADLGSLSPSGGEFYPGGTGPRTLEVNAAIGVSAICAKHSGTTISLPPNVRLAGGARISFIQKRVDPGHGLYVFHEGASAGAEDDSWVLRNIVSVGLAPGGCGASEFLAAQDAGLSAYTLTLDSPLPEGVTHGTPVRLVERARYALYQSSDSRWYLGYCASSNLALSCPSLQPLSGPYAAANADQTSGLSGLDFYYYNADGFLTSDLTSVTRVEVALRGSTFGPGNLSGAASSATFRDTLRVAIGFRNRP
jgi:hypothetical protein